MKMGFLREGAKTLFRGLKYLDIFFIKGCVRISWKNVKIWRQQLGGILVF